MKKWLGGISKVTGKAYLWHLESYMDWAKVNSPKFGSMTPDDWIEYALDATPRQVNDLLDMKKEYLLSLNGVRLSHKANANKAILSFFAHNRVELPKDKTLNLHGDKPKVKGVLTPEHVKQIVNASNLLYQAVFLVMLGSGMGQAELVSWSDEGYEGLKAQLDSHAEIVKVELHGRKGDKNDYNYTTFIGGDALKALSRYVKARGSEKGAIFVNTHGEALTKVALYRYWTRKLIRIGIKVEKGWTGTNTHELRDVYRTLWRRSGVDVAYGEYFMGHREAFDKYGYDKTGGDEDELRAQYSVALPFLNILSETKPFKLVREVDVEKEVQKQVEIRLKEAEKSREAEIEVIRRESETTNKSLEARLVKMEATLEQRKKEDGFNVLLDCISKPWAQKVLKEEYRFTDEMINAYINAEIREVPD